VEHAPKVYLVNLGNRCSTDTDKLSWLCAKVQTVITVSKSITISGTISGVIIWEDSPHLSSGYFGTLQLLYIVTIRRKSITPAEFHQRQLASTSQCCSTCNWLEKSCQVVADNTAEIEIQRGIAVPINMPR
jgi:hypothetical protein